MNTFPGQYIWYMHNLCLSRANRGALSQEQYTLLGYRYQKLYVHEVYRVWFPGAIR